jgi:outer membrane protein assembly factor BamB
VKLHFFPALLPLAAVIPWALGALGTLLGVVQIFLRKPAWQRLRFASLVIAVLCLAAGALWLFAYRQSISLKGASIALEPKDFPKITRFPEAVLPQALRAHPHEALQPIWELTPEHQSLAAPVFADGLLLQGTFEHTLDAYDASSGRLLWSLEKTAPVYSTPVVDRGVLYLGEGLHTTTVATLTAIELKGPKVLWHRKVQGHLETAPKVAPDGKRLFVTAGDSGLWCFETSSGEPCWHQPRGHADMLPHLELDRVIVGFQPDSKVPETELYAFDALKGRELWNTRLPGQPWGEIAKAGDRIVLSTSVGQLGPHTGKDQGWAHALDPKDGKKIWSHALSSFVILQPLVSEKDGIVVFTLKTGELIALRLADGSVAWQSRMQGETQMAAVEIPGTSNFLSLTTEGRIEFWSTPRGEKFVETPYRPLSVSRPGFAPDRRIALSAPDRIGVYQLRKDLLR